MVQYKQCMSHIFLGLDYRQSCSGNNNCFRAYCQSNSGNSQGVFFIISHRFGSRPPEMSEDRQGSAPPVNLK